MRRRPLLGTLLASPALAFPDRPIRLVVAYPPGGGTNLMARAIAQRMGQVLGQSVVIDNRSGASGTLGAMALANAAPDGHTLLFVTSSEMSLRPLLDRQLPFDADRDFTPIALLGITSVVLAVNPALPVHSVAELVALAHARPERLSYASSGIGGLMHLTGDLFRARAGIDILHVPYRGAAQAVNDTAGGQVEMVFMGLAPVLSLTRGGRLRILAISTPRRFGAIADVPTLAEAGLPGFDMSNSVGLVAPRGTPAEVIAGLNAAANAAAADDAVRQTFLRNGAEALGSTPEGYVAAVRAERERFGAAIRSTGIPLE
ncbi:MAG: tripartite tricarboxylate transporter substrate binding protein [Rhodospirillales bacterium]|nr:tripartite tricarboxylate transporter substrate binding protein [Rhodospirillales bacterium]